MQHLLLHGVIASGGMSALPLGKCLIARRVMMRLIRWAKDEYEECGRALINLMLWHATHHEHENGCGVMLVVSRRT